MPGSRLTADEREEIALGVATGRSFADIAVQLGRPTSTVSREVDRNGGRGRYRAGKAQRRDVGRAPLGAWQDMNDVGSRRSRQSYPRTSSRSAQAGA